MTNGETDLGLTIQQFEDGSHSTLEQKLQLSNIAKTSSELVMKPHILSLIKLFWDKYMTYLYNNML